VNGLPADDAAAMVQLCEAEREKGVMLDLVIASDTDDGYLGEVLLFVREADAGELAYAIAPSACGRGLATGAVTALTEWAFDRLGIQRLYLRIHPDNAASIRVAEKAGYRREGLLRSAGVVRGERVDLLVYGRLPTD
jgi:RimJ/RimL family protein N-acetyltransferase